MTTRLAGRLSIAAGIIAALAATSAAAAEPDLVDLVLGWSRGSFRSPLLCTFDGETREGLRRVVIAAGPPQSERRVNRLTFFDVDAPTAQRCATTFGGDVPNVIGSLLIGYTSKRPHSDTPKRDFDEELRSGHLDFEIVEGRLRIGPVTTPPKELAEHDFARGRARIAVIASGSDEARLMQEFGPSRRLRLTVEAPDGTRVELPLVEFERR
jgi:hypothetical protein